MADLTLRHPANGANQVIPSEKFDHIAFDFPSDSVVLSKEGNDLLLSFEDGSRITLTLIKINSKPPPKAVFLFRRPARRLRFFRPSMKYESKIF